MCLGRQALIAPACASGQDGQSRVEKRAEVVRVCRVHVTPVSGVGVREERRVCERSVQT